MTWTAQVVHVARKDVHRIRWLILLYVAVTASVTAMAMLDVADSSLSLVRLLAVAGTAMFLVAVLIQSDPPTERDAFWTILPLHRTAVAAAKLLVAMVVIGGIPLLGQLVALSAFQPAAAELPFLMLESVMHLGFVLALAAMAAVLTADLRGFAVLLIALYIGILAATLPLHSLTGLASGDAPEGRLSILLAIGALLALVVHQYATRDARQGRFAVVPVMLVVLLAPALGSGSGNAAAPAEESTAADLPPLAEMEFAIAQVRYGLGEATLQVSTVRPPPGARILLRDAVARFEFEDGTHFEVSARDRRLVIGEARDPFGGRLRVLGQAGPRSSYGGSIDLPLTEAHTRMLTQRRASVSVRASAEVSAPRVRAELPLDRGARHLGSGESIRIEDVGLTPDGPMVTLRTRILDRDGEGATAGDGGRFRMRVEQPFALVNRTRGEAVVLRPGSSGGESGMGLVLFRPGLTQVRTELHSPGSPRWEGSTPVPLDQGWLDGATLAVIDWVPVGTVPVAIHARPLIEPSVR